MGSCYQPLNPHFSYSSHNLNIKLIIVHRWRGVSCQLGGKRNGMIIRKRKVKAGLEIDMGAWRREKTVYMRVNWHGPALQAIYCNREAAQNWSWPLCCDIYIGCLIIEIREALNCSSICGCPGRDVGRSWPLKSLPPFKEVKTSETDSKRVILHNLKYCVRLHLPAITALNQQWQYYIYENRLTGWLKECVASPKEESCMTIISELD